jgi:hypothetical protein
MLQDEIYFLLHLQQHGRMLRWTEDDWSIGCSITSNAQY